MVTLDETARALEGVYRIAVFDRAGVASFGKDLRACARSFWAYAIGLPATLLLVALAVAADRPDDPFLLAASQLIGNVVQAAGFPLLMLPLLRWYGRRAHWAWFVTGYNWLMMAQAIALVAVLGLMWDMPSGGARAVVFYALLVYFYVLEAFLADAVLHVGALRAGLVVALDIVFSNGIDRLADWIGGVS
jgi:predicted cobalt transporter CbtA